VDNGVYSALFLCTGNSARSILAECALNRLGHGRFKAFSAGSFPKGAVHPYALDLLRRQSYPVDHLRSKSWNEFAKRDAPELDFVFTVCDNAAGEVCPIWPGQPMSAHWGLPDPAAIEGNEAERRLAFAETLRMLNNRLSVFVNLPIRSLDRLSLQARLDEILPGCEARTNANQIRAAIGSRIQSLPPHGDRRTNGSRRRTERDPSVPAPPA
jgi:protein-tyrosine-phosphatase